MMRHVLVAATLSSLLAAAPAAAEQQTTPELQNTQWWFLTSEVAASIALGFVVPDFFFPNRPENPTCEDSWCETNGFDTAIQKAIAVKGNAKPAALTSHIFTLALSPALALSSAIVPAAMEGKGWHAVQDSVIILNAFLLATGFNSLAKVGARRQRPAFHYGRQADTEAGDHPGEEFVSFYSGDTTWAFTLASSATTLAYLRGRKWAPYMLLVSGTLALTGGVLRTVADMHWATDVLVGAVTGTAVGIGLPLLLHRRSNIRVTALPTPEGPSFNISAQF